MYEYKTTSEILEYTSQAETEGAKVTRTFMLGDEAISIDRLGYPREFWVCVSNSLLDDRKSDSYRKLKFTP